MLLLKIAGRAKIYLFLSLFFIVISSCEKDDPLTPEEQEQEDEMNEDPANTTGRFSDFLSCEIIGVPTGVGLSSYYTKYINCSGIPIIGSNDVSDEALQIASETVEFMLTGLGNVRSQLISDGNYVALYPRDGVLADLPESFEGPDLGGVYTWNDNGNGVGLKALASGEASILCIPEAGVGHTLVHEIAHMIDVGGIRLTAPSSQSELTTLFNQSISNGLWDNTYSSTNPKEYLAEGVTIWYGVNWIGPEGAGDFIRNNIATRAELQTYDSGLYNFINSYFNDKTDLPGCREPVISGASASCPDTITDIDGNIYEIVNIGPMCWMKENLKTTKYNDGTSIQNMTDGAQWAAATSGAWATYDNDASNDDIYGKIYNLYALTNTRNICPEGWHVPDIQEIQDVVNYAGGDFFIRNLLDAQVWSPPGNNSIDFSLRPGGFRSEDGSFLDIENVARLGSRTSNLENPNEVYARNFLSEPEFSPVLSKVKTAGASCRCIKDN
jgi:uncharacterized protein (TIGR02145 family)